MHVPIGNGATCCHASLTLANYYNMLLPSKLAIFWQGSLLSLPVRRVGAVVNKMSRESFHAEAAQIRWSLAVIATDSAIGLISQKDTI